MSKLTAVFQAEIARIARREIKKETAALTKQLRAAKKQQTVFRREIARLEREIKRAQAAKPMVQAPPEAEQDQSGSRLSPLLLKKLRKRLGISQSELASLLAVSQPAVASWEQGRAKPRGNTRSAIIALRDESPASIHEKLVQAGLRKEGSSVKGARKATSRKKSAKKRVKKAAKKSAAKKASKKSAAKKAEKSESGSAG